MPETKSSQEGGQGRPANSEGYPSLAKVMSAIQQDPEIPNFGLRRLELNTFASGEATYKVWTTDAEEEVGGWIESV